jgi:hypothetical protein
MFKHRSNSFHYQHWIRRYEQEINTLYEKYIQSYEISYEEWVDYCYQHS